MQLHEIAYKEAETLMELLVVASGAKTEEEKARVCWRACDHMWRNFQMHDLKLCRAFNNLCQDKDWAWIEDLWSKEEVAKFQKDIESLMSKMKEPKG